jgi:hypothetical protein
LAKERLAAQKVAQMEELELPSDMDYGQLTSLSFEAREKLREIRPQSLGQASRIPGVSPSDIQNLVLALLRLRQTGRPVSRETLEPAEAIDQQYSVSRETNVHSIPPHTPRT